jgi:hypothetical protein
MTKQDDETMKNWRILTPVLLMVLSGIMAWSGFAMQAYLGQIVSTVNEVRIDLKNYMKESSQAISDLKTRVSVLERDTK